MTGQLEWDVAEHYDNAVGQMRSGDPADRLAGLYALERIAKATPAHRQACVDPMCAYLRVPFDPAAGNGSRQELTLRQTAQRLIVELLRAKDRRRPRDAVPPADLTIDLRGAVLVDLDLTGCRVRAASFAGSTFRGDIDLDSAVFGVADFQNAYFHESANLRNTRFAGQSRFSRALFCGQTDFSETIFGGETRFEATQFLGTTTFDRTAFRAPAKFTSAKFYCSSRFTGTVYDDEVWFDHIYFTGEQRFQNAVFRRPAHFENSRFDAPVHFQSVTFGDTAVFDSVVFGGDAMFKHDTFGRGCRFREARFQGKVDLSGADRADFTGATAVISATKKQRWPRGWAAVQDSRPTWQRLVPER